MSRSATEELRALVEEALARGASNLFLAPDEPPVYRIRGEIERGEHAPLTGEELSGLATELLGKERLAKIGTGAGSADTRVKLDDALAAVVTVARSGGTPTLTVWPVQPFLFDVERIGVPDPIVSAIEASHGLVLVTGPTGCGKTTTCYALLEHLNATRPVHIVSAAYHLEHVLEPKRALVSMRHVGVDAPDMPSALGSALMQDPDVLFVAEVRDLDVLGACLAAAETGHVVLTQLHQPDPASAIRRIVQIQPEEVRDPFRESLASMLRGVLAQRLFLRADGKGRVPAYGYLVPDDAIREAIGPGGDLDLLDGLATQTIESDLERLRGEGLVPPGE